MPKKKAKAADKPSQPADLPNLPLQHGALTLPLVTIDDFNNETRDETGFIGDRANKKMFQHMLEEARKRARKFGPDPMGDTPTKELSKKKIDAFLQGDNTEAAALVLGTVEEFAQIFADVIKNYLKEKSWAKTERITVGGGFRQSRVGELVIARAEQLLKAEGIGIQVVPIIHHPDKAGLIGSIYLMPSWMLKGYNAILAVDIGGTNVRAGLVEFGKQKPPHFADPQVTETLLWRHADDKPSRTATIKRLADMLKSLIETAAKNKLKLAPVIGIACPGIIRADGSIDRGGQNLPGGNWESDRFNLSAALTVEIPQIGDHTSFVMMHNDAVVQGLSQIPEMADVTRWAVLTIGTGLGNARFTNREAPAEPAEPA